MADGTPIHRSTALRYGLWPALSRAGLRRVNMYFLRHSFSSALIMAGEPVTEVQSLLGHSSPGVYSYWFKKVETDSVDRLAKSLTNGSKILDTFLDNSSRLLRRQIPHKYLISLRGEVAEWSKAPDC
jgi:hypothetical protein